MTKPRDGEVVVKLLRAIAGGTDAQDSKHDIILNKAADLIVTLSRQLAEARAGVRAALNMVDGDGFPPDWDQLRKIVSDTAAMGTTDDRR